MEEPHFRMENHISMDDLALFSFQEITQDEGFSGAMAHARAPMSCGGAWCFVTALKFLES